MDGLEIKVVEKGITIVLPHDKSATIQYIMAGSHGTIDALDFREVIEITLIEKVL